MIARYLACLGNRIEELPDRRERRDLTSDAARAIVVLKTSKFTTIVNELTRRWGKNMPEALYTDERTNGMLHQLEDCMLAKYDPGTDSCRLIWSDRAQSDTTLPVPIIGLEYTLTFYYSSTPIDLKNVTHLDLSSCNLTGSSIQNALISPPQLDMALYKHEIPRYTQQPGFNVTTRSPRCHETPTRPSPA
jgi:hypothetical protein